jgi:hypothetical protein
MYWSSASIGQGNKNKWSSRRICLVAEMSSPRATIQVHPADGDEIGISLLTARDVANGDHTKQESPRSCLADLRLTTPKRCRHQAGRSARKKHRALQAVEGDVARRIS